MNIGKKFSLMTFVVWGVILALPAASLAADCGASVEKARAEWKQIEKKCDDGELNGCSDKAERSLSGLIDRADKAAKSGKRKRCDKLLKKVRSRWMEKGWQ